MKMSTFFALGMVIVVVSFLGFLTENIWLAFTKGVVDNRNMTLPFLLGYGCAIVAIYFLFGTPLAMEIGGHRLFRNKKWLRILVYFLCVMICVSVGEIALGMLVEKTCNIVWWDYTRLPMHITRYTSIPTSMAFALLITIFMMYFFPPIMDFFQKIPLNYLIPISTAGLGALLVDFVNSAIYFAKHRSFKVLYTYRVRGFRMHKHEDRVSLQ